jgi:thioesterase domain-containing protein
MDPLRESLVAGLGGLAPRAGEVAFYSTVSGARQAGQGLDAAYWGRNLREPVEFAAALEQLRADGHALFVEVSPHPVLLASVEQLLRERGAGGGGVVLPSLRRGQPERAALLATLGVLYTQGCAVAWEALSPGGGRCVELPAYPWQRRRYWFEPTGALALPASSRAWAPAEPEPSREEPAAPAKPWEELSPDERRAALAEWVTTEVRRVLAFPADERLPGDRPLAELGLDSIMAVQIMTGLGARLGRTLPTALLAKRPTLEGLMREVEGVLAGAPVGGSSSPLLALRETGERPPFFCVHAVHGLALAFQPLAEQLGEDQPFYGLQARGADTDEPPEDRIERMAWRYLEAVRRVQPKGPYRLGGWSFGGLVAFEMACQLREAGEEVAALVVMDLPGSREGYAGRFMVEQFRLLGIAVEEGVEGEGGGPERLAESLSQALVRSGALPRELTDVPRQRRVYRAHLEAMLRYVPRSYDGPLTLLRARELREGAVESAAARDETFGWGAVCRGPVESLRVSGHHFNMVFEPHVRELAAVLRGVLGR